MTKEEAEDLAKEKLAKVESRNESELGASDDEATDAKKLPEFTEEEYLLASPVVLGFSFGEKLWLEFTVSGIKEISWNANAYESLVLEPKTKETVKVRYMLLAQCAKEKLKWQIRPSSSPISTMRQNRLMM